MLDLRQIKSFYPESMRTFGRNLLREYLQYKILEIIYDSKHGGKLSFMGGTAIHIIHFNTRFSEDLDFDNLGLNRVEFESLGQLIKDKLELQGCPLETRAVIKKAFRLYLRIPELLFSNDLSKDPREKIHVQVDTEPQRFEYSPDKILINKFDVFGRISVVPVDILLAQKIHCIFKRKRAIGRDFYDALFLMGKTKPNLNYLKQKLQIESFPELKSRMIRRCKGLNFRQLSKDVEPFLFEPADSKRVLFFAQYIKDHEF
ncbi:MAG: nucleotidyl transferase AbiEii/AbiGii toxin family protein [Clostridiales bacterium]|nr:nucleotidyl transferase AbiEii/AbiGii toxin family protein [Clostridiales bacterium]